MRSAKKFVKRRSGRGSLVLIVSLLFCSAAIRIGIGAGQAVATESPFTTQTAVQETSEGAKQPEDLSRYGEMLEAFQLREKTLKEKEQKIEMRLKALQVADEEIDRRLTALQNAEETLSDMLAIASTAAEDDLARLTSVYENMKPKDAAALFEEMEPAFAAGFLGRMKPAAAAGVMAGLSPETAYSVSVLLAGRNAEVPEP